MKRSESKLSLFGIYLWNNRISDAGFATMMANHLKVPKFSRRTVEQWRYGKRIPRGKNLKAIKELTGISADSFLEPPKKETEPDGAGDES
jgi:transcriptional regulator with XRE-family HTH domain